MNSLTIAVDFDGTIVKHEYPNIGELVPGAIDALILFKLMGLKIVLNTMRGDKELAEAVQFLKENGITLDGVNRADNQSWTTSPKVYAQFYIDDAAIGTPLIHGLHARPYVNWEEVTEILLTRLRKEYATLI